MNHHETVSRLKIFLLAVFSVGWLPLLSQNHESRGTIATDSSVTISSYFNAIDPRDEWTELLVVADNADMRNWTLQDNNSAQTTFQPQITFSNIPFWNNLRAGTIIMIWHRQVGSSGTAHPTDAVRQDGYVEISANDAAYFNGGSFGTAPSYAGATLNIAGAGDLLQLLTSTGTFVHALGHKTTFGSSWPSLPSPKLNHKASLADGDAVFVCPGGKVDEYGFLTPQDGTVYTSKSNTDISFGLPNCTSATNANSDYWRLVRQPKWVNPLMTGSVNPGNTQVTLNWNSAVDPFPSDGTQGYIILRNSSNTFGIPADGHTYNIGDILGGSSVIAVLSSSQTVAYSDNTTVPCTGTFYRIYAFRYVQDPLGNDYNPARGRAYNESDYGSAQVMLPAAVAPATAASDRDNFCADDPGNITLSATGGSGTTLNWFTGTCGGTLVGPGTGTGNSITIASPPATTTYYARWENSCGVSACADVTVTVLPGIPVSISVSAGANPVCTGTSVTFTAIPVNPGTSPAYQWRVNGTNTGSNNPVFNYVPANGDDISCVLTSNAACSTGNPATSNNIIMSVSSSVPVSVNIAASENPVCTGTPVTFTATPVNPGSAPVYQWKVNGANAGTSSNTYGYIPANGDIVTCMLTSSASCGTGSPATSNNIVMSVNTAIPVTISISASENPVCAGTSVTFTATPANQGSSPGYQWKVNGTVAGTNSIVYSYIPANGDIVTCMLTSGASCATGSPATSNAVAMTISQAIPVSAGMGASPGISVCQGTVVTYTALPVNGGSSPSFQWHLNGNPVGGNNANWSNVPANGDKIFCIVNSSASCATNNPANSDTITITTSSSLVAAVTVSANHALICPATVVTFTAVPANEGAAPVYEWLVNGSMVQQGNSPVFTTNTLQAGQTVECLLTSSLGCVTQQTVSSAPLILSQAQSPSVILTDKDFICTGTTAPLDAGAGFASYAWHDGTTDRFNTIGPEGLYWVMVTDSLGCTGSDSVPVKRCSGNIFVPNAFTPNGDGHDDVFRVFASPDDITSFNMQIFSRWGELIFESNNLQPGWDGMKAGAWCPPDSFIWLIRYKLAASGTADETITQTGTLELVR